MNLTNKIGWKVSFFLKGITSIGLYKGQKLWTPCLRKLLKSNIKSRWVEANIWCSSSPTNGLIHSPININIIYQMMLLINKSTHPIIQILNHYFFHRYLIKITVSVWKRGKKCNLNDEVGCLINLMPKFYYVLFNWIIFESTQLQAKHA